MKYALGIDVGGTAVKAVAVDPEGGMLSERVLPAGNDIAGTHGGIWMQSVAEALHQLRAEHGAPAAVGVAAPGVPNAAGDAIAFMPGRLQGLEGLNWSRYLDLPRAVPVLNDAQAALVGEAWLGAARGSRNALLLTLGTGVGGAAMVDGRVLRGHLGRAGHLGHVSLNPEGPPDIVNTPGSLEDAIGECTLAERSGGRWKRTCDLLDAVQAGDGVAQSVWERSVRALAAACASLVNVLDPEIIVFGGGISAAGPLLMNPLERAFRRFEWTLGASRVRLAIARLGNRAGALGAARAALLAHAGAGEPHPKELFQSNP
jgi:glucokinase